MSLRVLAVLACLLVAATAQATTPPPATKPAPPLPKCQVWYIAVVDTLMRP